MNLRMIIAVFAIVFAAGISLMAFTSDCNSTAEGNAVVIEKVVSGAVPEHCDPSNCTPEQAAKCPYSNGSSMSATANIKIDNNCPATPDCPPSKCMSNKKQGNATL